MGQALLLDPSKPLACQHGLRRSFEVPDGSHQLIVVEIQNETHHTCFALEFACVPRIGEGLRLREANGDWASYDVLDVWYQPAGHTGPWVPYIHIRMTPEEVEAPDREQRPERRRPANDTSQAVPIDEFLRKFEGARHHRPTAIALDPDIATERP